MDTLVNTAMRESLFQDFIIDYTANNISRPTAQEWKIKTTPNIEDAIKVGIRKFNLPIHTIRRIFGKFA